MDKERIRFTERATTEVRSDRLEWPIGARCRRFSRKSTARLSAAIAMALTLLFSATAFAHPDHAAQEMSAAANAFIATLKPEQKAKAMFKLDDDNRTRWHFVPTEAHPRYGLTFREMTQDQQHMTYALLASVLSARGLQKTAQVMSLEQVLADLESGGSMARDPKWYFVSIFGKPSAEGPWAWRFEGHHLSLSFTVVNGQVASFTPSFFGTNPAEILSGPRQGLKVLADEEDMARSLAKSLNTDQKKAAIFSDEAPSDIITSANRKAQRLEPLGLAAAKMSKKQIKQLWDLMAAYLRDYRPELAEKALAKLDDTGLDQIHFAWAGSLEPREGHYYRIQAPKFLIEYDNSQNGGNHVHCVVRDLKNDFADDLLRRHYEQHHNN